MTPRNFLISVLMVLFLAAAVFVIVVSTYRIRPAEQQPVVVCLPGYDGEQITVDYGRGVWIYHTTTGETWARRVLSIGSDTKIIGGDCEH